MQIFQRLARPSHTEHILKILKTSRLNSFTSFCIVSAIDLFTSTVRDRPCQTVLLMMMCVPSLRCSLSLRENKTRSGKHRVSREACWVGHGTRRMHLPDSWLCQCGPSLGLPSCLTVMALGPDHLGQSSSYTGQLAHLLCDCFHIWKMGNISQPDGAVIMTEPFLIFF